MTSASSNRTIAPHGTWRSPITSALAATGAIRVGGLALDGDLPVWIEARPAEGGRNVALRRGRDGRVETLTPPGFNVRTRVHEYGGGAFAAADGVVFFANDADQRLWRHEAGGAPVPITPAGKRRHADLIVDRGRGRLVCVCEDHGAPGAEPRNTLVAVPLAGGEPEELAAGADFYAFPRLSPDGRRLAWIEWDHPRMPWQGTRLRVAALDAAGRPGAIETVAGGEAESIFQPAWSPGGVLHFVSDRSGFWNLQRVRDGRIEALCPMEAEQGAAAWVFGLSTYAFLDEHRIACAHQARGTWRLGLLDTATGALSVVASPLTEIAYLQAAAGRVFFVGASPAEPPSIHALVDGAVELLHRPSPVALDPDLVSRPQPVTFPTSGGAVAHALYYPPASRDFAGPPGERPPLLVLSHGGPTSATTTALALGLQFWTSRGFAVLDVNYRGSTGYGRAYREALDGAWGVADVDDCVAGARHLVERGLADGGRLAIRGGSAGGYTTLAALAFRDTFRAGASYYGVSDLEGLARDTHKFESRYLDSLIGPYPARRDLYLARSPIHAADRVACPVIFFQGLEDEVVPPDQAERMVEALRAKGLPVEYVTFPDEQHGFRKAENIAAALDAELAFYGRVFGFQPGEPPAS